MGEFLFDTLETLFSGGLMADVTDFLADTVSALSSVFTDATVDAMITVFIVTAASLVTIFLFIDIMNRATQEMISFDRLVMIFVKYFIAMVILIYLKDIVITLFRLASGLYTMTSGWVGSGWENNNMLGGIQYFPDDGNSATPSVWPNYSDVEDAFHAAGWKDGVTSYLAHMPTFLFCLLISMVNWIAKIAAYFITLGNAIMLIARAAFSPLGVVQLFDEGQRSSGIRYLKKFFAEGLSFAAILGILYAASLLQTQILSLQFADILAGNVLSVSAVGDLVSGTALVTVVAVQLSSIGAMFRAGQLSNDIVGV